MKQIFQLVKTVAALIANILITAVEAIFWVLAGVRFVAKLIAGLWVARSAIADGTVTCPRGHTFSLVGQVYECTACGYTYEHDGSLIRCPSVECRAPIAPYVNCPVCGLSVPNPFRIHT